MPDVHKNFAYSTVATAPSPATSGTSLVVAPGDGTKFPTVPFNATVWAAGANALTTNAEIVRVTAISTDTLTITRAQESSTARTVVVGDQIAATITKKTLTDAENSVATDSIWDTKGDLAVATAADTAAALPAGTVGQALTALASETTGLIYASPRSGNDRFLARSGAIAENIPRWAVPTSAIAAPASGTMVLNAIYLPKGATCTNIGFISNTTAANTPTHWWFSLLDSSYTHLRSTADQTTTAWAASTEKIVALSSTFTTTYEGLYYVGFLMTATTLVTLYGVTSDAIVQAKAPTLGGPSTTGLTTPPSDTTVATTIGTSGATIRYCYVS